MTAELGDQGSFELARVPGSAAEIWSVARELARAGDVDGLSELERSSELVDVVDELPANLNPSPMMRTEALLRVAGLAASYGRAPGSIGPAAIERAADAFTPPNWAQWSGRQVPDEVFATASPPMQLVDDLIRFTPHPSLVAVRDLLCDIDGTYEPGRAASVVVPIRRGVDGEAATLSLIERPGPPGLFLDAVRCPFLVWDEAFETALQNARRVAGNPSGSLRWSLFWRTSQRSVTGIGGPSIGLGAAVCLRQLQLSGARDSRIYTGAINAHGVIGSLLDSSDDLGSYPQKVEVAAASGATLVLPAVDHPAVTAWADRHGVMVELEGAQHLDDLTAYQAGAAPLVEDVCPYPGLAAYGAGDAGRFFGREALVAELLERATEPFVSVVGASGSGKSSLVRAGLLPSLAAGALPGSEEWPQIVLSPGSEPLAALAEALGTSQEGSVEQWCERAVESLLDGRHRASRVVLVIDQFEEMFTLAEPEAAAALIKAIVGLRHHRVLAVAIMRADYYAEVASSDAQFAAAFADNQLLVGPMQPSELRRAITGPAEHYGLVLEPRLVDAALREADAQPGALPLLSTALAETWKRREGPQLTLEGYRAAGSLRLALANLAESVWSNATAAERQALRSVLHRLVTAGGAAQPVRRQLPLDEVRHERSLGAALELLADQRLVTVGEREAAIAHDALLTAWPRLRTWLDDDSDGWRLHRAVAARALEWQADDRSEQLLERGPRLAALQSWQVGHPNELTELEQQFLNASLRQERRRTTTKRLTVSALALLGGIALIAGLTVRSSRAAASESRRWSAFNTDEVTVRTLAARAREQATVNLDLALLLAVEANSIDATRQAAPDGTPPSTGAEARSSLLEVLQRTAYLTAFLYGDERPRRAAVLAASGTRVAAGSDNGTVAFWDVDERVLVRDPVAAHGTSEVRGLAASPDGTMVASSGEDGTVRIWDPVTGNPVGEALTHNEPDPDARTFNHNAVPAVTFSPDGRLLASGDRHGSIIVWDLASRQPVQRLQERTGGRPNDPDDPPIVLTLDFSPDTALLASAVTLPDADNNSNEEGTFTLWDWRTGTELLQHEPVHNGSTNAIQFDPSGEHFITCGQDRSIILWDLDKLLAGAGEASTSRRFSPHNNGVLDCVFTPDGTTIVSTSNEVALTDVHDRAAVLEGAALQTTYERAHTGVVAAVSFDPGSTRFITSATDGKIAVSDLAHTIAAGRRLHVPGESPSLAAGGPASGVGISPDGRTAVVGRPDGTLTIFDGDTGDVRAGPIDAHNNQIWLISFAPDGRSFFTGSSDSTVGKWDAETGQQLAMFRGHADSVAINSVSLSPDGAVAASCDTAGTMHVWDADLATERWNASVAGSDCSVGWLTNNVIVAAGGIQVTSWDTATGERLSRHVGAHSEPIQALAVGPDRRTFVTGGRDVDAVLWDAATVTPLRTPLTRYLQTPRDMTTADATSSFGAVAIAAVNNGTIALNSLDNGQLLSLLIGHQNGARRVASDAAGARVVSAGFDGQSILWELDPQRWIEQACAIAGRDLTESEWAQYISDRPYHPTCSDHPR